MISFLFVLIVLLLCAGVCAVVGHLLWLVGGAILRGIGELISGPVQRPVAVMLCPRCGSQTDPRVRSWRCLRCGWTADSGQGGGQLHPHLALADLRSQVERWGAIGLLAADTRERIVTAILTEEKRIAAEARDREATSAAVRAQTIAELPPVAPGRLDPVPAPPPLTAEPSRPAVPLAARAQAFRAFQEEAAVAPEPVAAPPTADPAHRLINLLGAFLEEKSIRWGELVGGLLIVGCSLALVISFWASIAERPWVKYGLLNGVTALLFVLAAHAERRWKLPTTARGLAIIATLLTPLNFLAVASLVGGTGAGAGSSWNLAGEALAIAIFAPLVLPAGRYLVAATPWALLVGVVVPSASMLLLGRSFAPGLDQTGALVLGGLPWLAAGGAIGGGMAALRREGVLGEARAVKLLRLLGLTTFAAAVALGLVVAHAGPIGQAARWLAPLAPLVGGAIVAPGLLLWRRVEARDLAGYRTAGTAIAAAGALILLAGVVLAWPDPARVVPVAALDFVVFTSIAVCFRVPAAHALAGGCLVLVYLLGWGVAAGRLAWQGASAAEVAATLLSSASGHALIPITLACAGVAAAGARAGRRLDAQAYALVAALAGLLSLGLATWFGFGVMGDPTGATWVYAAFALGCPAFAAWWGRYPLVEGTTGLVEARGLGWLGSGLLLAALVQGLVYAGWPIAGRLPWIDALLVHASVMMGLALARSGLTRWTWDRHHTSPGLDPDFTPRGSAADRLASRLGSILDRSAVAGTVAAAVGLVIAVSFAPSSILAGAGVWLAVLGTILAIRWHSAEWFAAGQAALTWGIVWGVAAWLDREPWFTRAPRGWLDPRTLQAEGVALALFCLTMSALRLGCREIRSKSLVALNSLLNPPFDAWDRLIRGVVVTLLVALAALAAVPGSARELTPRDVAVALGGTDVGGRVVAPVAAFEWLGVPHAPAVGVGSSVVWGLALAVLLVGQWERFRRLELLAALGVGFLAAPLVAGWFEAGVAVATAWRWFGAVAFLAGAVLVWDRARLARWADRIGWRLGEDPREAGNLATWATAVVFGLGFLPMVGLAIYRGVTAALNRPLAAGLGDAWMLVGLFFVVMAVVSLVLRSRDRAATSWVGPLALVLGILPVVAVTLVVVMNALANNPTTGVEPGSFFGRIGLVGSVVPPLVLTTLTIVGFAIRERSARFAFVAGLFANLTATTAYLFLQAPLGLRLEPSLWVRLAQVNALVATATALAWMGALVVDRRRRPDEPDRSLSGLLSATSHLAIALNLIILSGGTMALWLDPTSTRLQLVIASPAGALALVLGAGMIVARSRLIGESVGVGWLCFGLVCLADFLALGLGYRDRGNWFAYHGMMIAQAMAGLALPLFAWRHGQIRQTPTTDQARSVVVRWSLVTLGIVVLFTVRGYWADPQAPWWEVGALVVMAGLTAGLAGWGVRPRLIWLAAGLLNLAASGWWCGRAGWWSSSPGGWALADLVLINIIALALPAPGWMAIERRWIQNPRRWALPIHQIAAWGALGLLAWVVALSLLGNAGGSTDHPLAALGWGAVAAMLLALGAGLWDDRVRAPVAGLYLLGLIASGWAVVLFSLPPRWLAWSGTLVLAAYSVGTSYLWSRRATLGELADRLGLPRPDHADPVANLAWLVPANLTLAAGVLILSLGTIVTDPALALRSASAHAALAECLAIGLLARGARRTGLQIATLGVGTIGAVAWGWAWIEPGSSSAPLDRAAVLLAATMGGAAVYGLGLGKLRRLDDDWNLAARRVVPILLGLAGLVLVGVLLAEGVDRVQGYRVAIAPIALVVVALTIVGGAGAALVAAIVPGRDPLGLSERGRTAYVYGAEVLIAALGAHLKLTLPWLFTGRFIHYWPLMLMALAFAGVSLSEIFRRQRRLVLAEPLDRTGAFLPVLPLLTALWNVPRPGEDVVYLLLVGVLYAVLASLRSSVGFGALAALAGNGAIWAWLSHHDRLSLLAHPQLWVIPPALCVLVGASLNRDRLTRTQWTGTQYGALLAIYLASTADIVLTGVARAPWLPVVLAGLAVAGIFTGIFLRVRGFLFLGVGFLSLALFSIIWYAAVDLHQTWLWAASGVVAGVLILILFGLFEKKRHEVLRVVGQLKEWNP